MGYHQLDTTGANNVFVPVGASYTVPQIGATLYAVWRAKEIEYEVERWQIVGSNIAAVKIDTVIRTATPATSPMAASTATTRPCRWATT